jgi:hypothetical protein
MTEQSGPSDPSQRPGADRPGSDRPRSDRPRQSSPPPRLDLVGDLNRWLIRQGAKNVRKEIGGQVRRTLGGGRRSSSTSDVWDAATNEIPPEVGEAPECQWCPICRAARRMRESGPGIGGQLSGAGEAVAAAVQDAFGALDGLLSKTGGGNAQRDRDSRPTSPHADEPRETASQGTEPRRTAARGTGSWGTATDPDSSDARSSDGEAAHPNSAPDTQEDGPGNEPDDRS